MDKQGPPSIVNNTKGNTNKNSVNTQCAHPRLLLVYLVTLSTMLCIFVLNAEAFSSYVCVCAEHLGQCQVQQSAKLEILVGWMKPVSAAHAASVSDSDTPINHCTLPGHLQW